MLKLENQNWILKAEEIIVTYLTSHRKLQPESHRQEDLEDPALEMMTRNNTKTSTTTQWHLVVLCQRDMFAKAQITKFSTPDKLEAF